MPPKMKITKEAILLGALDYLRKHPEREMNARALAKELGVSTQPLFTHFSSMEELKKEVFRAAEERYRQRTKKELESGKWPEYKAYGMAYIAFAREEKALFRLLFLQSNEEKPILDVTDSCFEELTSSVTKSVDEAKDMHLEMWVFVHGIATMIATGFFSWEEEEVSKRLTHQYQGMLARRKEENEKRH